MPATEWCSWVRMCSTDCEESYKHSTSGRPNALISFILDNPQLQKGSGPMHALILCYEQKILMNCLCVFPPKWPHSLSVLKFSLMSLHYPLLLFMIWNVLGAKDIIIHIFL